MGLCSQPLAHLWVNNIDLAIQFFDPLVKMELYPWVIRPSFGGGRQLSTTHTHKENYPFFYHWMHRWIFPRFFIQYNCVEQQLIDSRYIQSYSYMWPMNITRFYRLVLYALCFICETIKTGYAYNRTLNVCVVYYVWFQYSRLESTVLLLLLFLVVHCKCFINEDNTIPPRPYWMNAIKSAFTFIGVDESLKLFGQHAT